MESVLREQYRFIASSRAAMMAYVSGMSQNDFISSSPVFRNGSVRNLIVHICDTYRFWIAGRALKVEAEFEACDPLADLSQCIACFDQVDRFMDIFITTFAGDYFGEIAVVRKGATELISPLKLFTHVITHEFHHKGQIMSLSRDLGYIPIDADVIR